MSPYVMLDAMEHRLHGFDEELENQLRAPGWRGPEFPIQCSWPLGTRHVGTGLAGGRAYSCAARSPSSARGCGRRVVEADWGAVQPPYHEHTDEYPDDAAAGSAA